jgi:hypothetical protein
MSLEVRIAVVALAGMVLLYFALGSFLPKNWSVETSRQMAAQPSEVLPLFADFGTWQSWAAVAGTERADTKVEVEGKAGEAGHAIRWRSNQNEASMRLATVRDDGVDYEFFSRLGKDTEARLRGRGSLRATKTDAGCLVTWKDEILLDGLAERWFAWFGAQQEMQQRFQESSLSKLQMRFAPK